jgi:hypothetical protein
MSFMLCHASLPTTNQANGQTMRYGPQRVIAWIT